MLPEDTLKHYFNYRETPAPNTKHQSPITKRFEFDSGADFFRWLKMKNQNYCQNEALMGQQAFLNK